jgi:hypothetical protein
VWPVVTVLRWVRTTPPIARGLLQRAKDQNLEVLEYTSSVQDLFAQAITCGACANRWLDLAVASTCQRRRRTSHYVPMCSQEILKAYKAH